MRGPAVLAFRAITFTSHASPAFAELAEGSGALSSSATSGLKAPAGRARYRLGVGLSGWLRTALSPFRYHSVGNYLGYSMFDDGARWRSVELVRRRLMQDPRVVAAWADARRRVRARPDQGTAIACNAFCHFFGLLLLSHVWGYAIGLGLIIAVLSVLDYARRPIEWVGIVLLVLGFMRAAGAFPF